MDEKIDQFGRGFSNQFAINEEKSRRIIRALSDIKNQLQNDDITTKILNEDVSYPNEDNKNNKYDLDFKNLHNKIEILENKLNQINENIQKKEIDYFDKNNNINDEDQSIFHKIEINNSKKKQSKSIVVLENPNLQSISNFKFYHFLILLVVLLVVLTLIASKKLGLPISESLDFFLSLFS